MGHKIEQISVDVTGFDFGDSWVSKVFRRLLDMICLQYNINERGSSQLLIPEHGHRRTFPCKFILAPRRYVGVGRRTEAQRLIVDVSNSKGSIL